MHRTKTSQYKQIAKFLSCFTILQHTEGSTIISSPTHTYLIRHIQISSTTQHQKQHQLNQIIMTLSTHQSFNCKNILPLINFDIVFNKDKTESQIRAIYSHGRRALVGEIEERRGTGERFDEDALWSLVYSLAAPLAYLEQKSVIYGVLDAGRVFLDNDVIAIMDPSSTGIDPYEIVPNRLYSPQLLKPSPNYNQLNMFKSDVFVLGLLMLQCSLLQLQLHNYDQTTLHKSLTKLSNHYSQSFCSLIQSMLHYDPEQRPSFDEILMHVNEMFEIATGEMGVFEAQVPDEEDEANEICWMESNEEWEIVDVLETEYVRCGEELQNVSSVEGDDNKVEMRYYHHSNHSEFSSSPINQSSEQSQSSSLFIEDSMIKSLQKTKRANKPKEIKEKLIKNDYESFSMIGQNETMRHDFSQPVLNKNQVHRRAKTDYDPSIQVSALHKKAENFNEIKLKQSKENHSNSHNFPSGIEYSPLNKENLFTKPEIMNMIKHDMKKIQDKKKKFLNVNFSYVPENQQKEFRQIVKNSESHQKISQSQNQNRSFHQISLNSNRK